MLTVADVGLDGEWLSLTVSATPGPGNPSAVNYLLGSDTVVVPLYQCD